MNKYDKQVIIEKQDLTKLNWSKIRNSSGTAGSFLKSFSKEGNKKIYYKLSNYDNIKGVVGIENFNEIIVDRLLDILGVEHLYYKLIHADIIVDEKKLDTYVCASEDFKDLNEDKLPLDNYYDVEHKKGEDRLLFCINRGWDKYIYEMFVIDFLILNRDRHGANVEVLRNRKNKTIRLAPLFDHGLSLLFSCNNDEEISNFNVMEDKKINSYLGSNSARDNLDLIPTDKLPVFNSLKESDKEVIFKDLDEIMSQYLINKIWSMIYSRWCFYEDFCNKRK